MIDRKKGEDENTKIGTSLEWKEFFRWNKKHFSQLYKGYRLVKNIKEIADKNFKIWVFPLNEFVDSLEALRQISLLTEVCKRVGNKFYHYISVLNFFHADY